MPAFLIIEPEPLNNHKSGRGARGRNLELFLREYYGASSVSTIGMKKLTDARSYRVDHLFIGIPSSITRKDLKRVSFRKLHLFDYGDNEKVNWGHSDKEFLCTMTASYLKPWTQKNWGDEFNWGTLPIRRNKALYLCVKVNNLFKGIGETPNKRTIDTTFLGNPVVRWKENYGRRTESTRIHWLNEISSCSRFSFSGGFFMRDQEAEMLRENADELLKPLFLKKGRINFVSYFRLMLNAKTALTPPGNALWSYRHYEAIYAGAIPVSADFREAEMLVPLPKNGMVHVGSGESVLPSLEQAIKIRKDNPKLPAQNFEYLEQYMSNGLYDCRKRLLLERFMKQIEKD